MAFPNSPTAKNPNFCILLQRSINQIRSADRLFQVARALQKGYRILWTCHLPQPIAQKIVSKRCNIFHELYREDKGLSRQYPSISGCCKLVFHRRRGIHQCIKHTNNSTTTTRPFRPVTKKKCSVLF